ncbi:MAG: hypothetical protein ACLFNP_12720, partial [Spirochaetaceae bacterium]
FGELREDMNRRFQEQREDFAARFAESRDDSNHRFKDLQKQINRQTGIIGTVLAILTFFAAYAGFFA